MIAAKPDAAPVNCMRYGHRYNMSKLPPHQLALFQRAAKGGLEVDGTTYLGVSDFTDEEIGELEKGLRHAGVLRKTERL
jgi:hypothetical protein